MTQITEMYDFTAFMGAQPSLTRATTRTLNPHFIQLAFLEWHYPHII